LPIQKQVGAKAGEATTLNNIAGVYSALGDKRQALAYYEQALPLQKQVGDKAGEATTLNNIGSVYSALGKKAQALEYYQQALPLQKQVGDKAGEATTLNNIGGVYSALGAKAKVLDYYKQALVLQNQVGDRWGEAATRFNIAQTAAEFGEFARAEAELEIVVAIEEAIGHPNLESDRKALARMRALGDLARAEVAPDPVTRLLNSFPSIASALIAACRGDAAAVALVIPYVADLAAQPECSDLATALHNLLAGERNVARLIVGLDQTGVDLVTHVLQSLSS